MIKPCKYDYKTFLDVYLKKSPIEVFNFESFGKEKESEYKEVESFFTDEFINGFIDWVREDYESITVEDLRPKCFEIEGVGPFLLGQRFKNGNRKKPFVLLLIGFEEEKLFKHLADIKKIAIESFSKIESLGLTTNLRFLLEVPEDAQIWNQVVYGKWEDNLDTKNTRLERSSSPLNYQNYLEIYKDWANENLKLSSFVSPESEEDLEESAKNGLYFKFYVNEELAGIICGENENLYGHESVYIFEELILKKFRGKGHAKVMQRLFHNQFPNTKYIWGHILDENKPSL